jgi:hypothetical protein
MNKQLLDSIVKHVFANLAVIPSDFVNLDRSKSLMEKEYLLDRKLNFSGEGKAGQVWGCQMSSDQQEVKFLLGDCSLDSNTLEYCLLVTLKGAPSYGLYLVQSDEFDSEPMIACTIDGKSWLECNTFLQASFLAGMEQIRDTGLSWRKCQNFSEEFDKLVSFIAFHQSVYGGSDEGQEG